MPLLRMGWFSVFEDSMAVGAFGATHTGIFMVCSAGNEGPYNGSLSNEAPWILTVGASTIDGSIRADVLWEIPSLFLANPSSSQIHLHI